MQENSVAQTRRIVQYIGADTDRFAVLFNLFLNGEYRIIQRASRVLDLVVEQYPFLLTPYFPLFLAAMRKPELPAAVRRNAVRLLQFIDLPKDYHGEITEVCFQYLHDSMQAPAIKAFSLTVLHRMVTYYPELKVELQTLLEDRLPYESPAFRSRGKKILKALRHNQA
ncbi:MAG: hypothetical protein QM669_04525 [Siphonobacter sp.]